MTLPLYSKDDAAPLAGGASVQNPTSAADPSLDRLQQLAPGKAPLGTPYAIWAMLRPAARQRLKVMEAILLAGSNGVTDAEIEVATGLRAQSVSPRRSELCEVKLVVDSGRRRMTPRGRSAKVWIARVYASASALRAEKEAR